MPNPIDQADVLPSQEFTSHNLDVSADPYAGTIAANGKPIWSAEEAADNLARYGVDFTQGNYGALDDGTLTYGFWTYDQFMASYFHELRDTDGTAYNADAYYAETYGLFEAFTAQQQAAAANAIGLWDDLINISIKAAPAGEVGDIMFGAAYMSTAAGAHTFFPQAEALDDYYGTTEYGQISGDVNINWYYNSPTGARSASGVPRPASTSFSNFSYGSYGNFAITHELGHSLGLAHGGDYNASNGTPITYAGNAYFYQDSQQYTIMSYFDGRVTGQAAVLWTPTGGTFQYAQTPAVHDILAVQNIYGADYTTRAGDTVYGFNSTADRGVFDFTQNKAPIVTIWDGGGNDTLDLSGFNANNVIDINEGAFSSAGYMIDPAYKAALIASRGWTESDFSAFYARNGLGPDGRPVDNIAIAYNAKIENAIGGSGNDKIVGNALGNYLVGNGGNDTFIGGDGFDVVSMGAGNDTFVEQLGTKSASKVGSLSWDVITDFGASDKIDLSGLNHSFHFNGTNANKADGDVTYKVYDSVNGAEKALGIDIDGHYGADHISGPVTVVFANVDGGQPDIGVILLNHSGVSTSDFIFG